MKIGNKEFQDSCPKCGEIIGWIKKPGCRLTSEGSSKSYSTFSIYCAKCKYETETYKIRNDYKEPKKIEDVTPKSNFIKIIKII